MVLLVHPVVGTFRVHGQPVELTRLTDGEVADVDHFLDLTQTFLVAFAHLVRDEGAQAFLFGTQRVAVLAHDFTALWRGPLAPFHERSRSSVHDLRVVVGGGAGDRGDAFAIDRGEAVNGGSGAKRTGANHDPSVGVLDAEVGEDGLNVHGGQRYTTPYRPK